MRFEWDEAKRLSNIGKHAIDFARARRVFDGRPCLTLKSPRAGEDRSLSIAILDGVMVSVVWTARDDETVRIISARRARDAEERKYRQLYG
jgi:uncharacterized DUF497 family protein